jgi:Amt family ammonium transporter
MQCFAIAGIASVLWLVVGYSIAFSDGNAYFGSNPGCIRTIQTIDALSKHTHWH